MDVLITGATGFIGRALVRRLLREHRVYALTRRTGALPEGVRPVLCDLAQPLTFDRFPARIDAVVHLAQSRRFREFPAGAGDMASVNVAAPGAIMSWACAAGASRVCFISSGTVYEPYDGPMREDVPLLPSSILAVSKLAGELFMEPFRKLFPVAILRPFFPYGPGQTDRLIPDLVRRVRKGEPIELDDEDDGIELAPIFVDDVTEVIATAIEAPWLRTVNIAGPEILGLKQLGMLLGQLIGQPPKFRRLRRHPALRIVPDLAVFRGLYEPSRLTGLVEGLARTIADEGR